MSRTPFHSYAIVPAAGVSRRMGVDKLLLPVAGRPLIQQVLAQWMLSRVDQTVVILDAGNQKLVDLCRASSALCVLADPAPPQMKHSVQLGLRLLRSEFQPRSHDAWLLAPADLPRLSSQLVDRVVQAYQPDRPAIVVPGCESRPGHPAMFPWSCAAEVDRLGDHQGVDALLQRMEVHYLNIDDVQAMGDIDAPADYRRLNSPGRQPERD